MKRKIVLYLCFSLFLAGMVRGTEPEKPEKSEIASISLNNIPMREAARLISMATSQPIVVSRDAAKVNVDLHVRDINSQAALDSLCRAYNLWHQKDEKSGVIHIQTLDEFKDSLQFIGKDTVKVVQLLYPAADDVAGALAQLFVNRVVWTEPGKNSGDRYREINRALKRMDLLAKRGTLDISALENDSSTGDDNDDGDNDFKLTGELKKVAEEAAKSPIGSLKREQLEALVKKRMQKEVTRADVTAAPGVVFMSVLPETNSLMLRSADASAIEQMISVVEKLDKPSPQVLLEVKILSVKLDDSKDRALDFLFKGGDFSGGFDNGLIGGGSTSGQTILAPNANLVPQGTGIDSKAAIFNLVTENFSMRLQMLEKDERLTRLATPNLIVSNNESSNIFIGEEITVMEKAQQTVTYVQTTSETSQPNISWQIDAPRRLIGVSLLITPEIHADRSVTIRLLQEHSSLGSERKSSYSGSTIDSTGEDQYFISQDINIQRLVSTVVGQDRHFMVIGGLIEESVEKNLEKFPWLGDIPVIGELVFSRLNAERVRKEILIIIRPFVMLAPGETQTVSQEYLERMSQHPSAREDIPSLGVNAPDELAKPRVVNPNDPRLIRMWDSMNKWNVDDSQDFDVHKEIQYQTRRDNYSQALDEIKKLSTKQENEQ